MVRVLYESCNNGDDLPSPSLPTQAWPGPLRGNSRPWLKVTPLRLPFCGSAR